MEKSSKAWVLLWCNCCGKEWEVEVDDFLEGVEQGIYYRSFDTWVSESCCDKCLTDIKRQILAP